MSHLLLWDVLVLVVSVTHTVSHETQTTQRKATAPFSQAQTNDTSFCVSGKPGYEARDKFSVFVKSLGRRPESPLMVSLITMP